MLGMGDWGVIADLLFVFVRTTDLIVTDIIPPGIKEADDTLKHNVTEMELHCINRLLVYSVIVL